MQTFTLTKKAEGPSRILALGAHCDDIEIGCGGTILRLIREIGDVAVQWVVFCSSEERKKEANACADLFLRGVRQKQVIIRDYRDGFLPFYAVQVKEYFEELKKSPSPDLILTHYGEDRHQDHRLVSELTWNTWRNNLILEYEIPKYDGDLGTPNFFVHLTEAECKEKINHVLASFVSQRSKHWFTEDTFLALARLRGLESCAPGRYAEAYYSRKVVV
jgi:LmbE family N-acetylglucosaminyl deacetylase